MHRAEILAFALLAALCADANPIATKYFEQARKGTAAFKALVRGSAKAHGMKIQSTVDATCAGYIAHIRDTCSAWHRQLDEDTVDFSSFCTDPCWVSVSMANNTACLMNDPEIAAELQLLDVACSRRGPNNAYCGTVVMRIMSGGECEHMESESSCLTNDLPVTCAWDSSKSQCEIAIANTNLESICSPCISDLAKAVASITNSSGGGNIDIDSKSLLFFQDLLCVKVDGVFCAVGVKTIMDTLLDHDEESSGLTTGQLASICDNRTQTTCLRRLIPSVATLTLSDALRNVQWCTYRYAHLTGSEFTTAVRMNCLNCYLGQVQDSRRVLSFADNLCDKSSGGTYCLSLLNFNPPQDLEVCYQNVIASGSCSSSCNTIFGNFLNTYGCCFALLAQTMNRTNLVTSDDYQQFWAAVELYRLAFAQSSHGGQHFSGQHAMAVQDGSPDSFAPMGSGHNCEDPLRDESTNLLGLAICPAASDIRVRMTTFCAYTRAPNKIARAINLKLNCTAVLANEAVKTAIVNAIVRDIARSIGLPVDAITGVLFLCPTEAPSAREHHFAVLAAGPATLQFVIQSDNSAATDAAAAELDQQLSAGTMSFPALTTTVTTTCTTCASQADLANLATAADLVPTIAPPPPTSSASVLQVLLAVAAILIVAVIA